MGGPSREPPPILPAEPEIRVWPAGQRLHRVFTHSRGPTDFNPRKGEGRFHPIWDPATGAPIATLYAASTLDAAFAESIFRNVPVRGPATIRSVRAELLATLSVCELVPRRDLRLAALLGSRLRRLQLERSEIVDSPRYESTARYAEALFASAPRPDGIAWTSRLDDSATAIVLFGGRVAAADLSVAATSLPLASGPGYELVLQAANRCDILVLPL
jgi:hypothetical protein